MSKRMDQKKSQIEKNINYKNLITQYYNRDNQLRDVKQKIKVDAPQIQILENLNSFDKKLDNLIKTKRYDVQEMFIKPAKKLKRLLRVRFIHQKNTKENILKIIGGLYPTQQNNTSLKFTSFFRQISFAYFGQNLPFEWKKPIANDKNFTEKDGIVIKLPKSNEQTPLVLKFSLIYNPPKFNVESSLQKIVGLKKSTRIQVLQAFWQYVKNQKLQDIENKQIINADEKIRNTFKTDKLAFATINNRIRQLLSPVQPIVINLKPQQCQKVVDFIVQIEERPDFDIVPFFAQKLNEEKNDHPYLSINGKIKKFDKKYQDHAEKLRRHLAKRQVYKNFTPQYIQTIIQEQNQLLKVLKKSHPIQDHNKLQFILENQEQVQKEIKHYYEQLNIGNSQQRNE